MAANPRQTMAYAQRYMTEQGMTPTNTVASANNLKSSYEQEQSHQVHAVTRDSLKAVTQEAGNIEPRRMSGQVANDVSGNANSRTIGTPMTSHTIPQESMGSSTNQIDENQLIPSSRTLASSEQEKVNDNQEQEHQVHVVTRDSINATAQEAANMKTVMSGQTIRNQVEGTMASNRTEIDAQANQVQGRGDEITNKIKKNQNKGVNYRAAAKGVKEVVDLIPGVSKSSESQQK